MMSDDDLLISKPSVASMFRLQWEEVQQSWVLLYPEGMVKLAKRPCKRSLPSSKLRLKPRAYKKRCWGF
jgi:hypothetical protein